MEDIFFIPNDRYIYYDEDGEITAVSNTNDLEGDYIVLPLEKVINFLNGKESTSLYFVVYDTLLKKYVLKLKYYSDDISFDINDSIYQVPRKVKEKPDLTVVQDIKNKQWVFRVNQGLKKYFKSQNSFYDQKIQFSVTRNNDPHELYRVIIVSFKELIHSRNIKIPFEYDLEEDNDDISLYTIKRFEIYKHEVKK